MARLKALVRRVRTQGFTPREFRSICVAALALLSVIVVSGAAVRLTGSGLGCNDWPNCNNDSFVDLSTTHSAIEQIKTLTGRIPQVFLSKISEILNAIFFIYHEAP